MEFFLCGAAFGWMTAACLLFLYLSYRGKQAKSNPETEDERRAREDREKQEALFWAYTGEVNDGRE